MNLYVSIINEVVDYIESYIKEKLTLSFLAGEFGISDFHFNRMFKTVTGITLKQYILGRKLTKATELLKETDQSVIDIAYDFSFEYPEVFSRAFKKQFGVSPLKFRENPGTLQGVRKAHIVERDIINYGGTLALKGNCIYLKEFSLTGILVETNVFHEDFQSKLTAESESFVQQSLQIASLDQETYYTVVNCNGEDTGDYTVFCGRRPVEGMITSGFLQRIVPEGWYVSFKYVGDMFDIRETFTDELYRWILVKEAELNPNGIGMLNIYRKDYPVSNSVEILIPIKNPV